MQQPGWQGQNTQYAYTQYQHQQHPTQGQHSSQGQNPGQGQGFGYSQNLAQGQSYGHNLAQGQSYGQNYGYPQGQITHKEALARKVTSSQEIPTKDD